MTHDNMNGNKARGPSLAPSLREDQRFPDVIGKNPHSKPGSQIFYDDFFLLIVAFRVLTFIIWTGSILYATYHVYLAAEVMLPFQRDPVMNPGPFTMLLNRGRDTSDFEWTTFTSVLFSRLIFWYTAYIISTQLCSVLDFQKVLPWISPIMSFTLLWNLTGLSQTVYLFSMPVIYWTVSRTRSKLLVWTLTLMFLFSLSSSLFRKIFGKQWRGESGITAEYYFIVTAAWNYARCISYTFDTWERPVSETNSIGSLISFFKYVFYLPVAITGPLVLFEHFEKQILQKECSKTSHDDKVNCNEDFVKLLKGLVRMVLITILNELLYHYLYFRPLSLSIAAIYEMNLWAVCGTIYWLGQFFTLKYKVMYGIPSCVAEFDGLEMYPLPRCPAYLHRYSVLWKDFDRGLYLFLIRYIYIPASDFMRKVDHKERLGPDIHKLIASFSSYVYVYIWHSTSFDVLVWAALNFLGITFERIGSLLKKKIDSKWEIEPIIWDFIVEPILTVPLAAMSILNSSVFCGTLESAVAFSDRLWTDRSDNYVFAFLFCFTHVAVTIRTWDNFYPTVISNFKRLSKKTSQIQ